MKQTRLKRNVKGNKYKNEKVEFDGFKFDSKRERDRYIILKDAEKQGLISELKLQPTFTLIDAIYHEETVQLKTKQKIVKRCDQLPITYKADFSYIKDGKLTVEDVKGSEYMVTEVFKIKEKLMYAIHGIKVKRVYKPDERV